MRLPATLPADAAFMPTPASHSIRLATLFWFVALGQTLAAGSEVTMDPGAPMVDTDGKEIDAHGGGILVHEGVYYWYGEMRQGTTWLPACNASWGGTRVDAIGFSCYRSTDLAHWTLVGNVLPAGKAGGPADLTPDRVLDRPKVIYNPLTSKFVMWFNTDSMDYLDATTAVAVADRPEGPFTIVRHAFRPNRGVLPLDMPEELKREFLLAQDETTRSRWAQRYPTWGKWLQGYLNGQMARDMGLFVDRDGTAYQFYASEENEVMHASRLTPDFLDHAGEYRRIVTGSREAPAPFLLGGYYYMINSFCSAWEPNENRLYRAAAVLGPWEDCGNAFADHSTASKVAYLSQSTFVLKLSETNYLYMADRWEKNDLRNSRYVWLPLVIKDGLPRVEWHQKWTLALPPRTK